MKLWYIAIVVFVLAGLFTAPIASAAEDWSIKVRTLPPAVNYFPNNISTLDLHLANFTVEFSAQTTPLVYNETSFKLTFNVSVIEAYVGINITIPTTIENPAQNIGIYVDGSHNGYILSANLGRWILSFEVPSGEHALLLWLDPYQFPCVVQTPESSSITVTEVPEFSTALPIVLLIIASMFLVVFAQRKKARNKPFPFGLFLKRLKRGLNYIVSQDFETTFGGGMNTDFGAKVFGGQAIAKEKKE